MADNIGIARGYLEIDTNAYQLAIDAAQQKTLGFGEAADAVYREIEGRQKVASNTLINYANSLTRSTDQRKLLSAAERDVPKDIWEAAALRMREYALAAEMATDYIHQLSEAQEEANRWNREFDKSAANLTANHADAEAAQLAWRRAEATEALTLALQREEFAEQQLASSSSFAAEQEKAQLAWRRAEATEALTLALQREEFAEQAASSEALFAQQQEAAQLAWRRAEATEALTQRVRELDQADSNNTFLQSIQRQTVALGASRAEMLEYEAAERGVTAQAAPLIAALREKESAMRSEAAAMQQGVRWNTQYNMSQKQLEFALRGVPAQFTDIFVSLAGGQNPLMVLLQQGGQLKDMFGGVSNAVRVFVGEVGKIATNPWVLLAGAVAGVAYEMYRVDDMQDDFNAAIVSSGNYAKVSAIQFDGLVESIAKLRNVSYSDAAAALTAAVGSGQISSNNITAISEVAAQSLEVLDTKIEDTISTYVKLGNDPLNTLIDLNKQQNFLTAAQVEHIAALEDAGLKQDAANQAIAIYLQHQAEVNQQMQQGQSVAREFWENLKRMADDAGTSIGKVGLQIANLALNSAGDLFNTVGTVVSGQTPQQARELADLAQREADARADATRSQAEQAKQAVQQLAFDRETVKMKERTFTLEQQIAKMRETASNQGYSAASIDEREAAMRAADAKKHKGSSKGYNSYDLTEYKSQLKEEQAALDMQTAQIKAQYDARTIDANTYYNTLIALANQEYAATVKSTDAQIEFLRTQKQSGDTVAKIAELESQAEQKRVETTKQVVSLQAAQDKAEKTRTDSARNYKEALDQQVTATQRQYAAQLMSMGLGSQQAAQLSAITALYTKQADELYKLQQQYDRKEIDQQQLDERTQQLRSATEEQVNIVNQGYQDMDAARANWHVGLSASIQDYVNNANDIAGATSSLFDATTGGITDMLQEMVKDGKLSLDDLKDSITDLLVKFGTNKILSWLMSAWGGGSTSLSGLTSTFGNNLSNFIASANGNVFQSESLSKYSNGVYDSPKTFAFAKGAGVFAEAGPEAIMPLERDSTGRLGVSVNGGSMGGDIGVQVINNGQPVSAKVSQSTGSDGKRLLKIFLDALNENVSSGGSVAKTFESRYGFKRSV